MQQQQQHAHALLLVMHFLHWAHSERAIGQRDVLWTIEYEVSQ